MTDTATHPQHDVSEAMQDLASFPLLAAIYGRRSRRFAMGGAIPDGPLAYESAHAAEPTQGPYGKAGRWITEWTDGIDGTGVRPGSIKLGFNGKTLSDEAARIPLKDD